MNKKLATSISIVEYGVCNTGSIINMCRRVGLKVLIATEPEDIRQASKLLLPGVGSFDQGIKALKERGMFDAIVEKMNLNPVPLLGICLAPAVTAKVYGVAATHEQGDEAASRMKKLQEFQPKVNRRPDDSPGFRPGELMGGYDD